MIADSHAHLDMPQFDQDREEVIQRALDAGVDLIVTVATGTPQGTSVEKTLNLAERHESIYAGIGIHPHDARLAEEGYWEKLEAWAQHPKVVLWGEIGLDYYYDLSPRDLQRDVLKRQLRLARRHNLPVSIHCRDAWPDLIEILRQEYSGAPRGGVLHSFTGDKEQALAGAALGLLISFSGIVTFRNADALRQAAAALAPGQFLVETDSPYLAPVPHRGRRNEPAFVMDTARVLAQLRGISMETCARETSINVRNLLGLSSPR